MVECTLADALAAAVITADRRLRDGPEVEGRPSPDTPEADLAQDRPIMAAGQGRVHLTEDPVSMAVLPWAHAIAAASGLALSAGIGAGGGGLTGSALAGGGRQSASSGFVLRASDNAR